MKTKTLIASVALALAAVSGANAQIYIRSAVVARPAYGRVVYAYNYPVAPVVVTATAAAPLAPAVVYANSPAPAVVYAPPPAPAVVIGPAVYWGGWYGWGPRYYGRGYFYGRGWRR